MDFAKVRLSPSCRIGSLKPDLFPLHINYKEALCVVFVAIRWAPAWTNKTIHVFCDNTTAVAILNKVTSSHPLMMSYLRHLFWLSATFNFRIKVFHVPGRDNIMADHISRIHDAGHLLSFLELLQSYVPYPVTLVSGFDHMSPDCYYYLLGKFSVA